MKIFSILLFLTTHNSCSFLDLGDSHLEKRISPLKIQFDEIQRYSLLEDKLNLNVSKWSRYKHLEHILIANNQIIDLIEKCEEPNPKTRRSIMSYLVLGIGYIPRGVAEAPKNVVPVGLAQNELQSIFNLYETKLKKLEKIENYSKNLRVGNHPYFGDLTTDEWIRFIEIHTKHHLKIINEI